jgi:hypothetical protein
MGCPKSERDISKVVTGMQGQLILLSCLLMLTVPSCHEESALFCALFPPVPNQTHQMTQIGGTHCGPIQAAADHSPQLPHFQPLCGPNQFNVAVADVCPVVLVQLPPCGASWVY